MFQSFVEKRREVAIFQIKKKYSGKIFKWISFFLSIPHLKLIKI